MYTYPFQVTATLKGESYSGQYFQTPTLTNDHEQWTWTDHDHDSKHDQDQDQDHDLEILHNYDWKEA